MGMLYRRKKKDPKSGKLVEVGPWWMKYYDCGKPYYQSTGKINKKEAMQALTRAEGKVLDGQREGSQVHRTRFEDLVELLKQEYTLKGRKTWSRREQHIAHLKKVFGRIRVKAIASEKLGHYVSRRLKEGAANATVNRELDCLHRMMVLGSRQTPAKVGRIPHFPKLAETNVREGFFAHDEFLALRGAAPFHIKVALTIGYYSGMRLREIIGEKGLKWDQLDLEERCIRLSSIQTKTKTPRVIFMPDDFYKVLDKAKELRDRDFPSCPYVCHIRGKSFSQLRQGWNVACKRIGLEGKTFHDLRRTGIRNLVRAGVSETVAMKISGHKTRSVFDRYNVTNEADLKKAADQLNQYFLEQKVTNTVTPDRLSDWCWEEEATQPVEKYGGGGGIRTHGGLHHAGFQDRSIRPL
jgi:integrase